MVPKLSVLSSQSTPYHIHAIFTKSFNEVILTLLKNGLFQLSFSTLKNDSNNFTHSPTLLISSFITYSVCDLHSISYVQWVLLRKE